MFPWQAYTAHHGVQLMRPVPLGAAAVHIAEECLSAAAATYYKQAGPYHTGGWAVHPLVAPDGDPVQQFPVAGRPYLPTPHLNSLPFVSDFLASLPGELRRVRLSRLAPGQSIMWHLDDFEGKTNEFVARLHLPLVSHKACLITLSHVTRHWPPGELWCADFRFPHTVVNSWTRDRLHLVIDLAPSARYLTVLAELFGDDLQGPSRRDHIAVCASLLRDWRMGNKLSTCDRDDV